MQQVIVAIGTKDTETVMTSKLEGLESCLLGKLLL